MNALDSPLEALALNYLSYGFLTAINNIWAWVAVITAAVSFWRIRASSSPLVSIPEQRGSSQDAASTSSSPPHMAGEVEAAEPTTVSTPGETKQLLSPLMTTSCCVLESEGSPKVKFSLYFNEDDFREGDEGGEDEDSGGCNGGGAVVSEKLGWWCDDWERTMVVRMGDMGWYRCQDLKVLDGSVVRLWDGRRRRDAAAAALVA
ncbi:hypothetical protein Pfo_003909 [Paulownia fortunei]|nr:hypothetical protein Pfo_003909 [Paulownia fortunei]